MENENPNTATESVQEESLSSLLAQDDSADENTSLSDILSNDDGDDAVSETKPEEVSTPENYDWKPSDEFKDSWEGRTEAEIQEFEGFKNYAKEKGMKGEMFKELMDLHYKSLSNIPNKIQDTMAKQWQTTIDSWNKEIINDPVLGKGNYTQNAKAVKSVISKFGSPEVKNLFLETGWAANPVMFGFLSKIGASLTEGKFVSGSPAPESKPIHKTLYNSTAKK